MRAVLLTAVVAGTLASTSASASAETFLRITYWADSAVPSATVTWTLRCNPPRGSHPRPRLACRKLAAGGTKLFAPLPGGMACTQIYGGPQKARVVGTLAGRRIQATFARRDGCEIGRWNLISPWLVPLGDVT